MRQLDQTIPALPADFDLDYSRKYYAWDTLREQEMSIHEAYDSIRFYNQNHARIFLLPENLDLTHRELEYHGTDETLRVYLLDDIAERYENSPHNASLIQGAATVDSGPGLVAEWLRNDLWRAYMKGLGPGRYNLPSWHEKADDVADAIVDLFYNSIPQMVAAKGIEEMQVTHITDNRGQTSDFQAQRNAAILTIASRTDPDRECNAERAVQLVRANPATGRATPADDPE